MIDWLMNYPVLLGLITFLFMYSDWLLTIAQEKERVKHYSKHYQSYPINTIEGNPILQKGVSKRQIINPRHFIVAVAVGLLIAYDIPNETITRRELFLGFVWGLTLIVNTQHLSNLIGYKAGQKGIHGKLWIHQRTGFITQAGRYFSTSLFLLFLSVVTGSLFLYGVTIAGFISAIRQLLWIIKIPKINKNDVTPEMDKPNE